MSRPFDRFTTARLVAERLTPEHMPDVYAQDTDAQFMAMIGGVRTREETDRRFAGAFRHWDEHGYGVWMLRDLGNGEVIGRAVLRRTPIAGVDELEVGYAFVERYWGRGLATEITRAVLDLARRELGATSFVAMTDPTNDASKRVLAKCGFAYAGPHELEGAELDLFRARFPAADGLADGAPVL